ncbi:SbcC/MukB-like Walker B domain-containing protein [Streptomyces sp. CBMA370]|uniref:SbcC/MukB-like Walker B domain-containing protein n=1 Tax=Streptomyces sp. CBMA370 TaxID=1930278 RepID=UPI003980E428|nr:hypothetical protein [Streptomyces sp. CBMA370]
MCGSTEHPAPARTTADHVDRATEEAAYAAYTQADELRTGAESDLAVTREAWSAARAEARAHPTEDRAAVDAGAAAGAGAVTEIGAAGVRVATGEWSVTGERATVDVRAVDGERTAVDRPDRSGVDPDGRGVGRGRHGTGTGTGTGTDMDGLGAFTGAVAEDGSGDATEGPGADPDVSGLAREVDDLTRRHAEAHALAARTHSAREALAGAEREYEERAAAQREAERRVAARTSRRETLDAEAASLEEELTRARGAFADVAEHAALLERRIALLVDATDAVRTAELAADRLKEADGRLADAAYRAGFTTPAEAVAALLPEGERREYQRRVDAWRAEAAAVEDRLAEPGAEAVGALPPADPEAAGLADEVAGRVLRDASSALSAARDRATGLGTLSRQALTEVRRLGPLREEHDRVARLAGLTAGTSAENERRMRLESYVLAARLEQVAAAASARLQRMSAGRYTLVHSDARSGGRRSGLGLHVVDAWTGNERDTATLSGGETFFASLALALGLADVVGDEAGGVRLDTLFIDEGFGSLDEQTLDEVLDVLDSLRERDRSVGIVSHVADLRRRIPAQLEVVKERKGSAVRLRAGGEALGG